MGILGIEPRLTRYKQRDLHHHRYYTPQIKEEHQSASLLSVVCIRRNSASSEGMNTAALPSSLTTPIVSPFSTL